MSVESGMPRKLSVLARSFFGKKVVPAELPAGVVTFTFDDLTTSAVQTASSILERHGKLGTFYGSFESLSQGNSFTHEDAEALVRSGHELGWVVPGDGDPAGELERAARIYTALQGAARVTSCAFAGRRLPGFVLERFTSVRGRSPGLNANPVDLGALKANAFDGNLEAASRLIEDAVSSKAWLILRIEDISADPGPGPRCTPAAFKALVSKAANSGARVLPIRNALGFLAFPPAGASP